MSVRWTSAKITLNWNYLNLRLKNILEKLLFNILLVTVIYTQQNAAEMPKYIVK